MLDRPDPSDDRRLLAYDYRGGWGDPTSSAKSASDGPVPADLSKFDVTTTVGIMRGAPETLHMKPSDVKNTYLIVDRPRIRPRPARCRCTSRPITAAVPSSSRATAPLNG